MSKITIIGAGKTGRGFLLRLLDGNEITFIDKNAELCEKLNKQGYVKVDFFGNKKESKKLKFFSAKTWEEVKEINADVIFVSVGGSNLASVGNELKKYVNVGQRIIVCENASHPAKTLLEAIGINGILISESTVFCTTIENGDVNISSEWYPYLQFDAEPMKGNLPKLDNIKPVYGFGNFLTRKLYTYNSASCIIAYLGYVKGYKVYSDAANDSEILTLLDKNYEIINECMCLEYGYEKEDQKEFALLSRDKFTDRTIVDTVLRNGREPQRKIKSGERIIGPMILEAKYGKDTSVLEKTLAAALLFTPSEETDWKKMLEDKGYEGILTDLCGLEKNSAIYKKVLALVTNGKIL